LDILTAGVDRFVITTVKLLAYVTCGSAMSKIMGLTAQYCAHNCNPLPVELTRGEGVFVQDKGSIACPK
jgi:hypothetical protein